MSAKSLAFPVLAGVFLALPVGGKTKSVLVEFRPKFEAAVQEAALRNIPILFVAGKDH